jgi:uncharacterized protein
MQSALYSGSLRHHRHVPAEHLFSHRLFMLYLDLDELDEVFSGRWLWSTGRPAVAWLRREDHFGDPRRPLADCVRDLVEARLGTRPAGPVRLLTHLRYFGHCFNPVSFLYCLNGSGTRIEAMVLEVTNTPWKERHCYVLGNPEPAAGVGRFSFGKDFHVSPFLPMDMDYRWSFAPPGARLGVSMQARRGERTVFTAGLSLQRREITGATLAATLLRQPLVTMKVVTLIHYQALRLWLKRVPVYTHPGKPTGSGGDGTT